MLRTPTTRASWALTIARALEDHGVSAEQVFHEAGVDLNAAQDPDVRYPVENMSRIWRLAVEKTGNEAFGIVIPRYVHPTTFNALGFALMASESLKDAIERMVRFSRTVTDVANVGLVEHDGGYKFALIDVETTVTPSCESVDGFLATIIYFLRELCQANVSPTLVRLKRKAPKDSSIYDEFYRAPISFEADENAFLFTKSQLETKLPTANSELAQINDRAMTDYLSRFDRSDIVAQVQSHLLEQLSEGTASQGNVAAALHMSQRSLQRRLKSADTSYADILDEIREQLAAQYLKQSKIPLISITYLLGFSDPSNFNRAFKRWRKMSPSQYRKLHTQTSS